MRHLLADAMKPGLTLDAALAILDHLAALFSSKSAAKGDDLHAPIHPVAPDRLFLDEGRLRQILINLINHAIKDFNALSDV